MEDCVSPSYSCCHWGQEHLLQSIYSLRELDEWFGPVLDDLLANDFSIFSVWYFLVWFLHCKTKQRVGERKFLGCLRFHSKNVQLSSFHVWRHRARLNQLHVVFPYRTLFVIVSANFFDKSVDVYAKGGSMKWIEKWREGEYQGFNIECSTTVWTRITLNIGINRNRQMFTNFIDSLC